MRNNQKLWPKAIMLSVVLLCFTMTAVAQMIKVSGVVLDTHQEPVIGATVKVIGTGNGTVTDIDGKFSLEANRSARVSISYVGYKTLEQRVQPNMHVVMEEEANILSEVVAIGYGSVKRKDVTTAVSSVNTEDLETRPIVSAVQGMQGKAAGLQISQANGQPGSAPTIRVRGTTSLNGSNNPLYVVDGVPVDNIDYLSANDIDNIQILKDASSAAIYGSRAANGVVIIGTKQGKSGVAKVSLSAHYAFNTVRDNQDPLNAEEYKDLINDMNEKGVLSLKLPAELRDRTDWKKEVYRTGNVQNYQLAITNGNDKLRYYLSGGYTGENGVIVSSSYKRYNMRGSLENEISKWLTFNGSVAYSDYTFKGTGIISGTSSDRGGVVPAILGTPTYAPIWDPARPGQYYTDFYGVNVDGPLENIARTKDNKSQYNKLLATGKFIVTFIPELTLTSTISFDRSSSIVTNFLNAYGGTTGQETIPTETNALDAATGTMSRDWSRYLEDIAKANVLINGVEQLHKKGEVSDAEYRQWRAEGQIFRALMMFRMVRMWGSLPVITKVAKTITSNNIKEVYPTYFPPRSTTEECYQQIIEDLEYAELNAPDISSTDRTQMSKTVAQAFLCKVYAEKAVRDYDKVIAYAEKVRNTPGVALEKDFATLWGWNAKAKDCMKRNTTEGILEIQWFPGAGNWESWMYGRCLEDYDNSFTWAKWVTPSRDLIRAFEAENDTLRKNQTIVYYDCTWSNYYPSSHYAFMYKLRSGYNNVYVVRLADIILLEAEAYANKGNLAEAAKLVNIIRQRAKLPILDTKYTSSKEKMQEAVLLERRLELAMEGERWYDLCRNDKVESVMNSLNSRDEGRLPQARTFDENSYLLPIPQSAIDENDNLRQNPGY